MPSSFTFSVSSTKLYDSTLSLASSAPSSSTSRRTCSDSGSTRACEKTARRTGWTSRVNSSLSCVATSSVMSAIRVEYKSGEPEGSGGEREQRHRHPDLQVLAEGQGRGLARAFGHDQVGDRAHEGEVPGQRGGHGQDEPG